MLERIVAVGLLVYGALTMAVVLMALLQMARFERPLVAWMAGSIFSGALAALAVVVAMVIQMALD